MFFFLFKKKCWKFLFYLFLAVPLRPLPFGVSGELWWRGTCIRKKKGKFFSSILFLDVAGCMAISLNRRIFFYSFYSSLLSLSLLVEVCAHYHLHIYSLKKNFLLLLKTPKQSSFFLVSRYIGLKPPRFRNKRENWEKGGGYNTKWSTLFFSFLFFLFEWKLRRERRTRKGKKKSKVAEKQQVILVDPCQV